MESFENRDQEYLDRTEGVVEKQVATSEEAPLLFSETTERLTETPWEEKGKMVFELPGGAECVLEYDSKINRDLGSYLGEAYAMSGPPTDPSKYRRIKGFTIKTSDGKIDILDLCHGQAAYYYKEDFQDQKDMLEKKSGFVSRKWKFVSINMDPTSIYGMYAFLHEIGHVRNDSKTSAEKLKALGKARRTVSGWGTPTLEDKAIVAREERTASAFALKTMKEFLGRDTLDKIKKVGAYSELKTYYDFFNNQPDKA